MKHRPPITLRLDELLNGAPAIVHAIAESGPCLDASHRRRLAELGFLPGEPVQVLRRGPGGREPLAVRIGDAIFALRLAEARHIAVVPA